MPTPQATQNFMKTLHERFENKATRVLAAGTLVTMGALMLDACSTDPTPKPTHSHSAEASPTPEATSTPGTSSETMPASLEAAANASFADFLNLPQQDRLTYCSWITRDMPAVAANWESDTKDSNDTLTTITTKSTPQQLLTRATYNIRAAWISHEGGNDLLDLATAQKVLSCAYTNPNAAPALEEFNKLQQAYTDNQTGYAGGYYAQHNTLTVGAVTKVEGTSTVNGNPSVTVGLEYKDGATDTATLTTIHGVDYNGKPMVYVTADFAQL